MIRAIIAATSTAIAFATAPLTAAELVMVEEPGCAWCAKWEHELGDIYPKTPEGKYAPLRKVQLRDIRRNSNPDELGFDIARPVSFTPTFLLIENGAELARLQGYPGEDFFWGLLERMLTDETDYVAPAK